MPNEAESPIQTEQPGSSGGNNEDPISRRTPVDETIIRECESIVKDFSESRISKAQAVLELSRAITIDDEAERERVFEAQHRIIENVDQVRKAAAARGKAVVPGLPRDESPSGDGDLELGTGDDPAPQVPSGAPRRARDDLSDDEPDSPRKRVNVAALPWSERQRRNPQPIRESVRKTLDILENISREFRVAKASLFNDPLRPPFPDSSSTPSPWSPRPSKRSVISRSPSPADRPTRRHRGVRVRVRTSARRAP
ncbi:hypothetical protein FB107DRAFT_256936, partial [Schizophyllum commune]